MPVCACLCLSLCLSAFVMCLSMSVSVCVCVCVCLCLCLSVPASSCQGESVTHCHDCPMKLRYERSLLAGLVLRVPSGSRGEPQSLGAAPLLHLELCTCSKRLFAFARCVLPSMHHAFPLFAAPPASAPHPLFRPPFRTRRRLAARCGWPASVLAVCSHSPFLSHSHGSPCPRAAVLVVRNSLLSGIPLVNGDLTAASWYVG